MPSLDLKPSQTVRVTQTVRTRTGPWTSHVEGRVVDCGPQPTGSWLSQGKGGRLWLQRLRLERSDGEVVDLVLDGQSIVTVIEGRPSED